MKTRIIIAIIASAITLLSFSFISTPKKSDASKLNDGQSGRTLNAQVVDDIKR